MTATLPMRRGAPEDRPRAYPIRKDMPAGYTVVSVTDDRHWPHLRPGENVLIDTTDREIVFGELYLVRQSRGPVIWQVIRIPGIPGEGGDERQAYRIHAAAQQPTAAKDAGRLIASPRLLADGPIYLDSLAEQIIGRVVGLFVDNR